MTNNITTCLTNQINNQSLKPSTDMIQLTLTLTMTTTEVVKTSVTVNNSPFQDNFYPNNHTQLTNRNNQNNLMGNMKNLHIQDLAILSWNFKSFESFSVWYINLSVTAQFLDNIIKDLSPKPFLSPSAILLRVFKN